MSAATQARQAVQAHGQAFAALVRQLQQITSLLSLVCSPPPGDSDGQERRLWGTAEWEHQSAPLSVFQALCFG